jgi:type IV secretion system protein VirD4
MSIGALPKVRGKPTPAEEEEDARYLVNLIVAPSGASNDKFWENSAKNFLEGMVLYVRKTALAKDETRSSDKPNDECQVRERSMREVRRLLTLNENSFKSLINAMALSRFTLIRQAGTTMQRLTKGDGRTGNSVLAVALEQTSVWAYERLQGATYKPSPNKGDREPGQNDFEFRDVRDGRTTLYIVVPPDYLSEYRSVLRVLIGIAMREMRRTWTSEVKKKPPVLFMLDEFPQLGYMQPIEEALLYLAGYGIRFWFFVQDLSQLQLHYPNSWRTFMANTGTQCFFGVSDIGTANLVSEMAGTMTVANQSFGVNIANQESKGGADTKGTSSGPGGSGSNESYTTNWQSSYTEGQSAQVSWVGRRLITPDEVMRMHDEEQIIFMKGLKPIRAVKMPYYKNKSINELADKKLPFEITFE